MTVAGNGFKYICAHDMRPENPLHVRLTELWDAVREDTGGELDVTTIPWGGVGPSKVALAKLLSGEVAFHPISGMPLSTIVPMAGMEGLPYAYDTEEEACRVLDGPFGDFLRQEVGKAGLVVFPRIWPQGFNQITSSTVPIRDVHDLDGFKLRIAQVPYKVELFTALGCDPQQIFYQAIRDNLVSGVASGQETPYYYTELDGLADVQKYLSVTNHRFATFWMCANPQRWEALPARVRELVAAAFEKYVMLFREDMWRVNEEAGERLKKRLIFNTADTASFVERLKERGFYARMRVKFGEDAMRLLEEAHGRSYP